MVESRPQGFLVDRDNSDIELLLHLYPTEILAYRWSGSRNLHLVVTSLDLARELSDVNWFNHCFERDSWNLAKSNTFFCDACNEIVTTYAGPWIVLQKNIPGGQKIFPGVNKKKKWRGKPCRNCRNQ